MVSITDINKAIMIHNQVFGVLVIYSNPETWLNRNLFKIYFDTDNAFLAVEKRNDSFHIWLMGAINKGSGSGRRLFTELSSDLSRYDINKITISTFPESFPQMYAWLLKLQFVEFKKEIANDKIKIYLQIDTQTFTQQFQNV